MKHSDDIELKLVSAATALIAKELGFDEACLFYYRPDKTLAYHFKFEYRNSNILQSNYAAPTQALLQKWLRDKHNIHITPVPNYGNHEGKKEIYFCQITSYTDDLFSQEYIMDEGFKELNEMGLVTMKIFGSYEDALEAGLMVGLPIIKNRIQ